MIRQSVEPRRVSGRKAALLIAGAVAGLFALSFVIRLTQKITGLMYAPFILWLAAGAGVFSRTSGSAAGAGVSGTTGGGAGGGAEGSGARCGTVSQTPHATMPVTSKKITARRSFPPEAASEG